MSLPSHSGLYRKFHNISTVHQYQQKGYPLTLMSHSQVCPLPHRVLPPQTGHAQFHPHSFLRWSYAEIIHLALRGFMTERFISTSMSSGCFQSFICFDTCSASGSSTSLLVGKDCFWKNLSNVAIPLNRY